jgi:tetratricopeptide (TPR) repeat protein
MPRALAWFGAALLALGVAARFHNAWAAPVLSGYDAFAHFTYVWFVAETGRIPMPTHGWSFFHPPLYYASMAALWNALPDVDPATRLRIGKLVVAALGLVPAVVVWMVTRRRHPDRPAIRWLATGLVLLLPMQLYSAGFLGNEPLHAVCGALSLAALLALLAAPSPLRAIVLGVCLGLAMLAKFSAIAIVAACFVAVAASGLAHRRLPAALASIALATVAMLAVCGWYYARNVAAYGTPFQLSRDTPMVAYVEGNQPQAARGWADYLTFDPLIFRRPVWPRGATIDGDAAPHGLERAVRESVWTGLYANTWFDGFGGYVLPPVVDSEVARRAGQFLLTAGLVPTLIVLLGLVASLRRVRRRGWDDEAVALALAIAAMLVLFVYGTRAAPIAAAVKATYFTPIVVAFAFFFAEGLAALSSSRPRWLPPVAVACSLVGAVSLAVFWQGLLFDPAAGGASLPRAAESRLVQLGIVEYAGGRKDAARAAFEQAAASDFHLALENLAFLEIDEGRPAKGLALLRRAARAQSRNPEGGPVRREQFLAREAAEHDHSMAVAAWSLGRREIAVKLWNRAIRRDPRHAEALASLALAQLEDGLATAADESARRRELEDAARVLQNVRALDPGLAEGWTLAATVAALEGDCDRARTVLDEYEARPAWVQRSYPAETGTGSTFSASIGRRRLIAPGTPEVRGALEACRRG